MRISDWSSDVCSSDLIFIRALLSVTDNIADGKVVHPQGVTIHDGADPYFVVAADKGTASFSDLASVIALEQDFWLGAAFACGGSHGYEHKATRITARRAWVSVPRHYLHMGVDLPTATVRVFGRGRIFGGR